ncbi:peptidyl-tRNA hydrolase [Mycolicibacterium thermoresistibile]|nr:peptidyl-tRNA hydrolase [Mycolicibacterium thermoresistibile]
MSRLLRLLKPGPRPQQPSRSDGTPASMSEPQPAAGPRLIVGLGNPGPRYAGTRHNLGFMVADILAGRMGEKFKVHKKSGAEVITGRLAGRPVILAKPRCYMNESGRQVGPLAKFYSVAPADIVVIHDELDLEFGRIRLKFGGGVAGHNGLRSVSAALGTQEFHRVRIGIGRPPGRKSAADYVLQNFSAAERGEVPTICEQAAHATELLLEHGLEPAQNTVHAW